MRTPAGGVAVSPCASLPRNGPEGSERKSASVVVSVERVARACHDALSASPS